MLKSPEFKRHNIRLDNGQETLPGSDNKVVNEWIQQALNCLPAVSAGCRVADLGCLEGAYSVAFARAGYEVVGIEVRESSYECCQYVKEQTDLPLLSFVNDDVWNVGNYGSFDVIWAGGILYHLDEPVRFVKILREITRDLLILNTHYAVEVGESQFKLSEVTENEGYRGRWYTEYATDAEFEDREIYNLSSWDNRKSFWLMRDELQRSLLDAGFREVFSRYSQHSKPGFNRGIFVAKA
jgi:SAM-dependent methyltransferase